MYPRISDLFRDFLGFEFPIPIYSFGAMMAVAFLVAGWLARIERDRMYAIGRVGPVKISEPPQKGKKSRRRAVKEVSPSALVGTMIVITVIGGLVGAKLFHILENLGTFVENPLGMIFSTGGLTFYGGLIVAGVSLAYYARKQGIKIAALADAAAPGLMLAYGIGRIGCHLAGDGDWGIAADLSAKPDWLPMWLWAETYPNNILERTLPASGVYPTSIYEFLMAAVLFAALWSLRKHPFLNGWLFSLYLVFAGVERFLIEKIRVNNEFDLLGITVTQAEVISVLIMLVGVVGLVIKTRKREKEVPRTAPPVEVISPV